MKTHHRPFEQAGNWEAAERHLAHGGVFTFEYNQAVEAVRIINLENWEYLRIGSTAKLGLLSPIST
jgi:hypothetical protein